MAGVPPQLPLAEMVAVRTAAGADANAGKARMRAASAERRRAASPPEVREQRLPQPRPILLLRGGVTNTRALRMASHRRRVAPPEAAPDGEVEIGVCPIP